MAGLRGPDSIPSVCVVADGLDLTKFLPRKRSKGIVYYSDRKQELCHTPELSTFSPKRHTDKLPTVDTQDERSGEDTENTHVIKLDMGPIPKKKRKLH